ncbi:MAG: hypothetical protein DWQ10_09585, partial [Calditrichaeota bacterium]
MIIQKAHRTQNNITGNVVCVLALKFLLRFLLYLTTVISFTYAQSVNVDKLFKKAVKEKSLQTRLVKLNDVIEFEPTHTEALYETGNIYNSQ